MGQGSIRVSQKYQKSIRNYFDLFLILIIRYVRRYAYRSRIAVSETYRIRERGIYREILPKAEYFSRALYTFDIGQNDLTVGYFANMSTEQVEAYIPRLMERFIAAVQVQLKSTQQHLV
ncbi:hypothetical protein GUJ93_ZPchr0001g30361 [Zizania palustris]|uniref:Uncharacterized protein n=1 Tax=Zizania palustris TaxID=103762 RepID=A0A8J5S8S9_ZIZPA|nr:hypothetical protein GUJ93_ZPchr0001g30361 [Zizania palustris]